ncbi:PI-PLC X domain-containing protein 2 [Condylostylus longicornis]|uniref:PI-PLC X domain-containing protein 2 n=1 Tax=Condylostylus longicornis TaxID=2530218 RepID=UPI00244DD093|nr:PI-PLC X domain-containing protein 2 [Condylostylus longicornis]
MGCCSTKLYPYENWMEELPPDVRDYSVINLAIPGSHNCMSYGINWSSKPSLDADEEIKDIFKFLPCFVRKWSKTQSVDITEQLKLGIRYLDLRISLKDNTKFYFAHGLYAMEIFQPLKEVCSFLDEHPKEIIILDFQHFYGFEVAHHKQLQYDIQRIFSDKIYAPQDGSLSNATLKNCENKGKQVIIIYRRCKNRSEKFWADDNWPTPWPNTTSIKQLKNYLNNMLKYRNPRYGYVSQCILTPDGKYIAKKFYSSLKGTAEKVDKKMSDWIEEQRPGKCTCDSEPKVNVFIADFVHIYNGDFCKKIIELNNKIVDPEN